MNILFVLTSFFTVLKSVCSFAGLSTVVRLYYAKNVDHMVYSLTSGDFQENHKSF